MSTADIDPTLKNALANTLNRQAPLGLHAKIMQRIYTTRAAQLAVPSATPWVVLALIFAAAMVAAPLLPASLFTALQLPKLALPTFAISNSILFSVLGLICLTALSELPALKHAKKRV
jgi:hypothetical protein